MDLHSPICVPLLSTTVGHEAARVGLQACHLVVVQRPPVRVRDWARSPRGVRSPRASPLRPLRPYCFAACLEAVLGEGLGEGLAVGLGDACTAGLGDGLGDTLAPAGEGDL